MANRYPREEPPGQMGSRDYPEDDMRTDAGLRGYDDRRYDQDPLEGHMPTPSRLSMNPGQVPVLGSQVPYGLYPYGEGRRGSGRRPGTYDRGFGGDNERGLIDRASDEVASWFGDDEAQQRREEDHRGLGPANYRRSDSRIEEDVNDRLTDERTVDAREISVTVQDREVTLDGHVRSKQAKRRAEDCADSISGVTHVQNNLRVPTAESGSSQAEQP